MAKTNFRERLKVRGLRVWGPHPIYRSYMAYRAHGDYVAARAADKALTKLEGDLIDVTSERDEARDEVQRLRGEIARQEQAKLHLITKIKGQSNRTKEIEGIRKQMAVNLEYFHGNDRETLAILQSHIEDSLRRMEGV